MQLKDKLDVLTVTATDVARLLDSGELTSQDVVRIYLAQIEAHNHQGLALRAIMSVSPESALSQASMLDEERRAGRLRGPMHGVPIIIKDNIQTEAALGMPTTGGAVAFKGCMAKEDAEVIKRLRAAGLIILGKASLTEFCGNKDACMTIGWSALNGFTQSAWIEGGRREDDLWYGRSLPGGSSAGSAVGVAAGFAPLSIGSETTGSLVMPANRQGLYGLKVSHEAKLLEGALPLCMAYDGLGGMARSADDLVPLVKALVAPREIEVRKVEWKDIRVGFTDPTKYGVLDPKKEDWDESHYQVEREYEAAVETLRGLGAKVVYPVELAPLSELMYEGHNVIYESSNVDVKEHWPAWIAKLDNAPVKDVAELVEWNKAHADIAMPPPHTGQSDLLNDLNTKLTRADIDRMHSGCYKVAKDSVDKCLKENQIDLIIGPADCGQCNISSVGQCPNGVVPLGILNGEKGMGQPQGLMVMADRHQEGKILEFMKLWNEHLGPWKTATRLRTLK